MNVLVVDDEEIICESIKADFNRMDCGITFDVMTAVSVAEAEIILENEKIDLLVTDINMPGGSGLLLVEKVRKKNPSCGILVISAYDDFNYVRNAFTLGADDYILKPIAFLELKSHVEKIAAKLKSTEAEHSITDGQAEEKEKTAVFGMEEVTEYIRQHADEKLSAADLAKKMAVSYNSFGKLFKDHTQMSFSNYVLHYRMELAKEYLRDSSIKIKQVASKVGYKENPQHFSRDFTRQVGVSPKEYRENRN